MPERSAARGFLIARTARPRRYSPAVGKENVPPRGAVLRCRKSPLPSWYPRSPLHDITTVVNALERRRARRAQAAQATQSSLNSEASPQNPALTCPPPQEPVPGVSDTSPSAIPTAGIAKPFLAVSELPASSSSPAQPISLTDANITPASPKPTEPHKMLCSMINEIEKSAREYLMNSPKQQPAKMKTAQRTLMSMR